MTRNISPQMAILLEELELEQPTLVTSDHLQRLVDHHAIRTPTKVIAARLREKGWLLPTGRRGVWEFAPAAVAGPYSRNDPVTPLRAFLLARPEAKCALTFQAAAWAHGLADRAPLRMEVAATTAALAKQLPSSVAGSVFDPRLDPDELRGVPVLAPESVVVQMATKPAAVRSWASALAWLPELAHVLTWEMLEQELDGRPSSVLSRTGYLLQGLRPDLAQEIRDVGLWAKKTVSKTWFGPRRTLLRHDAVWQIADTILPFDPRALEHVA
jgi:hypothetical protein